MRININSQRHLKIHEVNFVISVYYLFFTPNVSLYYSLPLFLFLSLCPLFIFLHLSCLFHCSAISAVLFFVSVQQKTLPLHIIFKIGIVSNFSLSLHICLLDKRSRARTPNSFFNIIEFWKGCNKA